MPTAPQVVAISVTTGTGASLASNSMTLQAGDVVTVMAGNEGGTTGDTFTAPTTTFANGGITQLKLHAAASDCAGGALTFTVTANGTGTVTINQTNSASLVVNKV